MKALKNFEFAAGNESQYDWAKMLDGKIYELKEGEDYKCKAATFSTLLRNAARKYGKAVKTSTTETGMVIQATDATTEQIAAWVEADEVSKQKAKDRRVAKKAETNGESEAK